MGAEYSKADLSENPEHSDMLVNNEGAEHFIPLEFYHLILDPSSSPSSLRSSATASLQKPTSSASSSSTKRRFSLPWKRTSLNSSDTAAAAAASISSPVSSPVSSRKQKKSIFRRSSLKSSSTQSSRESYHLLLSQDYPALTKHLLKHPDDVTRATEAPLYNFVRKFLPIHVACAIKAPIEVVKIFSCHDADDEGSKAEELAMTPVRNLHRIDKMKNASDNGPAKSGDAAAQNKTIHVDIGSDGWLPIHLATYFHSSPAVVELLLSIAPQAAKCKNSGGYLPIHFVCANLPFETASSASNKNYSTRGQDKKVQYEQYTMLQSLLRAFPDSIHVPCTPPSPAPHETPLQLVKRCFPPSSTKDNMMQILSATTLPKLPPPLPVKDEFNDDLKQIANKVVASSSSVKSRGSRNSKGAWSFTTNPSLDKSKNRSRSLFPSHQHKARAARTGSLPVKGTFHRTKEIDPTKPTKLYTHISNRDWAAAESRLKKCPHEASVWTLIDSPKEKKDDGIDDFPTTTPTATEDYGCHRLPLHTACHLKPPLEVLQYLYNANQDALSSKEKYGMLPLHVACQNGASVEVILFLLREHKEAASVADNHGLLPLHLACTEGLPVAVIVELLRAYPHGLNAYDERRRKPRDYVKDSYHPNSRAILKVLEQTDPLYWGAPNIKTDAIPALYTMIQKKEWERIVVYLNESSQDSYGDDIQASRHNETKIWVFDESYDAMVPRLPIHVACFNRAPRNVLSKLLDINPESITAKERHDQIPLHIACSSGSVDAASMLLQRYPEGAKCKDSYGLLPIHDACSAGTNVRMVEILLKAYPASGNIGDTRGNTPISFVEASFHPGRKEVLEVLKKDPSFWMPKEIPKEEDDDAEEETSEKSDEDEAEGETSEKSDEDKAEGETSEKSDEDEAEGETSEKSDDNDDEPSKKKERPDMISSHSVPMIENSLAEKRSVLAERMSISENCLIGESDVNSVEVSFTSQ